MPTDPHGRTHAGTRGLFDDEDERERDRKIAEAHEIKEKQNQIRRLQRHDAREERKEQKAATRAAQGKSTWRSSFLGKMFGGGKDLSPDATPARRTVSERPEVEYVIERRLPTPEPVYTAEDIDPVDSPWLRECGMVKVKSADPGGCHIVPKSVIEKSE